MERSRSSTSVNNKLEWENLQIPRFSMSSSSLSQSLDDFGKLGFLHPYKNMYDEVMSVQNNNNNNNNNKSNLGEPLTGLRLGRLHNSKPSSSSLPVSSIPAKRSRASFQNMQNPCCQVEGCNLDLKLAKDYHRRHRICETHSKSPKVIVAGMERRFCQQCSRFHELSEFDDKKRSCRRRLSDHNARRRRVQPESIHQFASPGLQSSSALYDQRPPSISLNGLPISLSNTSNEVHNSISRFSNPPCFTNNNNSGIGSDLLSAQSLLSSNSWSLNESSSMEGFINYNNNDNNQQQNLSPFESNTINPNQEGGPAASLVNSINLQDSDNSHLQEFHLFYDSGGRFYSTQRNL